MRTQCNNCIADDDDRYNDGEGCVDGEVYGYCSSEHCGGICEPMGRCDCQCHQTSEVRP